MKALIFKLLLGFAFGNIVWINGEEFIRPSKSIPDTTEVERIFNMSSARDCIQITKNSQNLEIKVVTAIKTKFGYDCLIPLVRIRIKDLQDAPGRVTIFMHDKFKMYGDKFYEITTYPEHENAENAFAKCKEFGADLVVIESKAVLRHVLDFMNRNADVSKFYWVAYYRANERNHIKGPEGWRMPNGTTYTGEISPNDDILECNVLKYYSTSNVWDITSYFCHSDTYYICQRE